MLKIRISTYLFYFKVDFISCLRPNVITTVIQGVFFLFVLFKTCLKSQNEKFIWNRLVVILVGRDKNFFDKKIFTNSNRGTVAVKYRYLWISCQIGPFNHVYTAIAVRGREPSCWKHCFFYSSVLKSSMGRKFDWRKLHTKLKISDHLNVFLFQYKD